MAYAPSQKPAPGTPINWMLAPASLVAAQPLIEGEDPVTTREYVLGLQCDINTFVPGAAGATTWKAYGVNMNGGGAVGARAVAMPTAVLATLDPHCRTIAWAQRYVGGFTGAQNTTAFVNNTFGVGRFSVEAPTQDPDDPNIIVNLNNDAASTLVGVAGSTLINQWHALVISWSDGLGASSEVGMRIWDDGVLIASKTTCPNPGLASDVELVGAPNRANGDFEYWYELNELLPANSDIPGKLVADGYYFFRWPKVGGCGNAFTVNPCPEDC